MSRNKKIMKNTKLILVEQIKYMNTSSPMKNGKYTIFISLQPGVWRVIHTQACLERCCRSSGFSSCGGSGCESTFGILERGQRRSESEPKCA